MTGLSVVNGGSKMNDSITVKLDGKATKFNDFVAVGYSNKKGEPELSYNADLLTMLMAMVLIKDAFQQMYDNATDEEKQIASSYLKGD